MKTKTCPSCGSIKPVYHYYFRIGVNGNKLYFNPCKKCYNLRRMQWYKDNRDAVLIYQRKYIKDNPDKNNANFKKWLAKEGNLAKQRERNRACAKKRYARLKAEKELNGK